MVAVSAFGGLCVHIMASSRMCFVGARNGHMPSLLSYINIKNYTPVPSLVFLVSWFARNSSDWSNKFDSIFQCILSLFMLVISDVHVLITYSMIVESFFIMLSVSSVLYFRYKEPDMPRPIKVRSDHFPYTRMISKQFVIRSCHSSYRSHSLWSVHFWWSCHAT